MIQTAKLVVSKPHYAFKPDTWRPYADWYTVDAIWFKRRRVGAWRTGDIRTIATMGTYQPMVLDRKRQPADGRYESWINTADDNRYGGDHQASWDGERFLGSTNPEEAASQLAFLKTMLTNYPSISAGYDGWYTFERSQR